MEEFFKTESKTKSKQTKIYLATLLFIFLAFELVIIHCLPKANVSAATPKDNLVTPPIIISTPTPSPSLIKTFLKELFRPEDELPKHLFDISLELDDILISDISELIIRVVFTSFGTEPTPVELAFTIFDEKGKEVHKSFGQVIVQTEEIFTQKFEGLSAQATSDVAPAGFTLPQGKYTLGLKTLYGEDVEDEFRAGFTIAKNPVGMERFDRIQILVFFSITAIALLVLVVVVSRKLKKRREGLF